MARRRTTSGMVMSQRSTTLIGSLMLALASPVAAQAPAPSDREAWVNDQPKPAERTQPPPAARPLPLQQPRIAPPARTDDEFDVPASPGCQYRDNKLELLV
jgi:hypothetical protein